MTINKLSVSHLNITENMINQRIDNFLIKKFKKIPKSMIYRIIRIGKIRINKKRVKPKYKLKLGDKIKIPAIKDNNITNEITKIPEKIKHLVSKNILYEDNYLLIINKPSGIAVHGGSGLKFGIIEILRHLRPLVNSLELVHRLDKDTSGILMLSKKPNILRNMHQQLREKKIKKKYIALVHGRWPNKLKKISLPLLKNHKKLVSVNSKGKNSETRFIVKKLYSTTSLMLIRPITGRTHQIRVHALSVGHPIVFDNRYGNTVLDKKIKISFSKKLLLHANKISFTHPKTKKIVFIQAKIEKDFKQFLSHLI